MTSGTISRVLVVEDDASLAESIISGLLDERFAVEHAPDDDTAWQAIRAAAWELVILDWWLPGQDGLTILRRHRDNGGTTPVLLLTARDAVSDRVRGLNGGADDYLCKPFAFEELLARVRERTRLYGQVWGEDYDFISNTLDVHIKELRRKIEAHGLRLIHTLRGRGYVLGDLHPRPRRMDHEPGNPILGILPGRSSSGPGWLLRVPLLPHRSAAQRGVGSGA